MNYLKNSICFSRTCFYYCLLPGSNGSSQAATQEAQDEGRRQLLHWNLPRLVRCERGTAGRGRVRHREDLRQQVHSQRVCCESL